MIRLTKPVASGAQPVAAELAPVEQVPDSVKEEQLDWGGDPGGDGTDAAAAAKIAAPEKAKVEQQDAKRAAHKSAAVKHAEAAAADFAPQKRTTAAKQAAANKTKAAKHAAKAKLATKSAAAAVPNSRTTAKSAACT